MATEEKHNEVDEAVHDGLRQVRMYLKLPPSFFNRVAVTAILKHGNKMNIGCNLPDTMLSDYFANITILIEERWKQKCSNYKGHSV